MANNELEREAKQRQELEQAVIAALNGLRFGSIEITMHDGRIVQIERKEKIRPDELRRDERR